MPMVTRFHVLDDEGYPLCNFCGDTEFAEDMDAADGNEIEYSDEEEADEDAVKFGGSVEAFTCFRTALPADIRRASLSINAAAE